MILLKLFPALMVFLAIEISTASDSEAERLLKGTNLTKTNLSKEQIKNIARLLKPKIIKDQGIAQKTIVQIQKAAEKYFILPLARYYDEILHKLKNKNQLFIITHLLNAKKFLKLPSTNKEYFEKTGGNVEKLQSHLSRDFIIDFPIYFTLPFPENTLSAMEYFDMFCLHFGTEISYSTQYVDRLRNMGVNIFRINETSSKTISAAGSWDFRLVDGELLISLQSYSGDVIIEFRDFKFNGYIPLCWVNDGHFYSSGNEKIKSLLTKYSIDFDKKICIPGRIESDDYKVSMCISPANFQKYIQKYPILDL